MRQKFRPARWELVRRPLKKRVKIVTHCPTRLSVLSNCGACWRRSFPPRHRGSILPSQSSGRHSGRSFDRITGSSGGVGLLMLDALIAPSAFAAVVDASDSFDPSDVPEDFLSRLLWVRCEKLTGAIQAVTFFCAMATCPWCCSICAWSRRRNCARYLRARGIGFSVCWSNREPPWAFARRGPAYRRRVCGCMPGANGPCAISCVPGRN